MFAVGKAQTREVIGAYDGIVVGMQQQLFPTGMIFSFFFFFLFVMKGVCNNVIVDANVVCGIVPLKLSSPSNMETN